MKNLKAHKTIAFIAMATVIAFLLGLFNMGLDDKVLNLLPLRWVLIGLQGYASWVFYNLLNF
jgi:hypothetical protein